MVKNGDETAAVDCCHAEALCSHEPSGFLHGLRPRHLFSFIRLKYHRRLVALHERQKKNTRLLVRPDKTRGSRFLFWSNTNDVDVGRRDTNCWLNIHD